MVIGMVDNCYPEYSIPIINQNGWLISEKKKTRTLNSVELHQGTSICRGVQVASSQGLPTHLAVAN